MSNLTNNNDKRRNSQVETSAMLRQSGLFSMTKAPSLTTASTDQNLYDLALL